jgi:HEAT repeat protein
VPAIQELLTAFAQVGRRQRLRANQKLKRRFTQALLQAGNGRRPTFLARPLSRGEHRILILAGIDLLSLVQGAAADRIMRVLARFHARETLQSWIRDPDPRLRAKAAEGMGYIADAQGCLALGRTLEDSDEHVRFAAAVSLIKLGAAPPMEEMMASFEAGKCTRLWRLVDQMRAHHPDAARRSLELDEAREATVGPCAATAL